MKVTVELRDEYEWNESKQHHAPGTPLDGTPAGKEVA